MILGAFMLKRKQDNHIHTTIDIQIKFINHLDDLTNKCQYQQPPHFVAVDFSELHFLTTSVKWVEGHYTMAVLNYTIIIISTIITSTFQVMIENTRINNVFANYERTSVDK